MWSTFIPWLIVLLLRNQVTSQGLRLPDGQRWATRRSSKCGGAATCVSRQRCEEYRYRSDWRNVARVCSGRGRRENVCCPIRDNSIPPQRSPKQRQFTQSSKQKSFSQDSKRFESMSTDNTCGTPASGRFLRTGFVMGGEEVPQGMYPWMVAVLKKRGRDRSREEFECTGFLIDHKHVLSAAHCFRPVDASRYSLRIGNVDWREGSSYEVARIDIPEGYRNGRYYDDLALLTTVRPVLQSNVVPICLPTGDFTRRDLTGFGTTVAGWGAQMYGGEMSDKLRHLNAIPVISNIECDRKLASNLEGFESQFNRGISRGLLCAGFLEGGKDSCGGDSGGPLMLQQNGIWYAVGIVSFGFECGRKGYPAGYTRISEYLNYIRRHTS